MTNAIILAGGFGTRLRDVVSDVPKPLAPIGGRPFLDLQLDWLLAANVKNIVITAHHMADQIEAYAKIRNAQKDMQLTVVVEDEPLGTGGAVVNACRISKLIGDMLVMNGDTFYDFDLSALLSVHKASSSTVTMAVAPVKNCARYGTVCVEDGYVASFEQAAGRVAPGFVSCGIYVINQVAISSAPQGAFSIETDFFVPLAKQGKIAAYVLETENAFFDIGIPEVYAAFCERY